MAPVREVIAAACPFCGGTPLLDRDGIDRPTYAVVCRSCAAQGPWVKVGESGDDAARVEAVRRWNGRV